MLYPEQNEARLKLSLDGTWAFALGSCVEDQFDPAKPLPDAQPIAVPASYNDQNDQTTALRRHYGWAWYQRKVTLPAFCAGQRVALRFGSVTHTANVWLNGQLIAQHPACGQRGRTAGLLWIGQRGHPQCGGCQARRRTPEPPQL